MAKHKAGAWNCSTCGAEFATAGGLGGHMKSHAAVNVQLDAYAISCRHCKAKFGSEYWRDEHEAKFHIILWPRKMIA